jgi:hypothetical protein
VVALVQPGHWTLGVLVSNVWNFAGQSERPAVNQMLIQYGGGIGRIMKVGAQPISVALQFYGNAVHPAGTSPWSMRTQISFLFPKLSKEQQKMMLEKKLKQLEQKQQTQPPKK